MITEGTTESDSTTYDRLLDRIKRTNTVEDAAKLLTWDQEVMMPESGTPARSRQLSTLSAVTHDQLVSEEMGEFLDEVEPDDLDDEQRAVVRETRRRYERKASVPTALMEELSRTTSEASSVWKDARETDDFESFAPVLEKLIALKQEYADHVDASTDPYEVLFEDYAPYIGLDTAEDVLATLRDELVPFVADLETADADLATPFTGTYAVADQRALVETVLHELGYDWARGRLDTADHPFSVGSPFDARIATRFEEVDPLQSVTGTIHEFGHAFYTQGLPDEHYGTPLGQHRGLVVHESQSRLWENHVGRSQAFWEYFGDAVNDHLRTGITSRDLYEAANRIYPDNRIRVEADELTYHLHIILRYEIERDLIRDDLDIEEVPAVWNDKMEKYLGVRPETDAEGCLQDIHWAHGSIGYFPTYSLGSVLAAQLFAAAQEELGDIEGTIREGDFDLLAEWLRENIHRHGQRYTSDELIERATGEPFTADYFVDYATEKFGGLYDI